MLQMNFLHITKDDMLNGEGLRVVLWTAGCTHHCKNCHNPITWDITGGIPFEVKLPNTSLKKAMKDVLNKENLSLPYDSAGDAISSMLED